MATSNSVERAQKFVDGLQIPKSQKEAIKAYGSYEELLEDPECGEKREKLKKMKNN